MATKTDAKETESNTGRRRPAEAYKAARERTYSAYESARDRAADLSRQATDQVGTYPLSAIIGGLAMGALIGWMTPATRREAKLLSPAGKRITEAARSAAQRGLDAGREQVEEIRDRATKKVGEAVVDAVASGAKS